MRSLESTFGASNSNFGMYSSLRDFDFHFYTCNSGIQSETMQYGVSSISISICVFVLHSSILILGICEMFACWNNDNLPMARLHSIFYN